MGKIVLEEKRLVFQRRDELVVIEPYGANCLRCRATRNLLPLPTETSK